jgi:hypothetical protein
MATESVIPPVQDNEVMGQMMLQKAKQDYPYLADKEIPFVYTPVEGSENLLEVWKRGEEGEPSYQRPTQIPLNQTGIQVFTPEGGTPLNILGDYVSHYGVEADPRLAALYQQFQNSLSPEFMQDRYKYHQENFGEKRPYQQWYEMTGLPEIFRGYTFNQFKPEEAKQMYNAQQLQILDQVRNYLGIK